MPTDPRDEIVVCAPNAFLKHLGRKLRSDLQISFILWVMEDLWGCAPGDEREPDCDKWTEPATLLDLSIKVWNDSIDQADLLSEINDAKTRGILFSRQDENRWSFQLRVANWRNIPNLPVIQ